MKKIVLFLSVLFTLALTSCESYDVNDPMPYCFKVTQSASYAGKTYSNFVYAWGTGAEVKEAIEISKKIVLDEGFTNYSSKVEKTGLNKISCDEFSSMGPY